MKIGWPHLISVAIAGVLLVGAGYALANMRRNSQPAAIEIAPPEATPPPPTATAEPATTAGPYHVYVSGAVVRPAVYDLAPGSLIDDAVRAAGGFTSDADRAAVNLAQPAADGMQVHVPTLSQMVAPPPPVSLPAGDSSSNRSAGVNMGGVTTGGLVDINMASQTELEMLPGIGPATAAKIIAYREANGPFATIEAIMNVPGIGQGKFEALRELITAGP